MAAAKTGVETKFSGFPATGLKFLRELKENNDRDWFRERKTTYDEQVHEPMLRLVNELAAECKRKGFAIRARDRSPVMRVYRDIRFSPDKQPFKTHVGASLKGTQKTGEVYIHVSPEESFLAGGFWMPERPFLMSWRQAMTSQPEPFLRAVKALKKKGLALSTEGALKRLPRGFDQYAESELAPWLRLTSFIAVRNLTAEEYRSASLVKTARDFALNARPLLEYGWALNYAPRQDILDDRI